MAPKKWQLIKAEDVSPSKWFPLEKRTYQTPDGRIVNDFYVTTLADVAMIVPITKEGKIILIRGYKQGADDLIVQFPAGRTEPTHQDMLDTAIHELEEETGIKVTRDQLKFLCKLTGFSTKASEVVSVFIARDVEFNSQQNLDENEEIEVFQVSHTEMNQLIESGQIWCAQTIAVWHLLKVKHSELDS